MSSGWNESGVRKALGGVQGGLDAEPEGGTGVSIGANGGAEDQDGRHPVIRCQIYHRKQSGRRYNALVLYGAALGVGLIQGIGLNPRGTHMRFVSTRWSLSGAGLISALALAACSQPAPAPAPAPAPVVTTAPPMMAPVVKKRWRRHSRAWYRRHHMKHRKM